MAGCGASSLNSRRSSRSRNLMAERIQRRRTKGWRLPENTVYVGRPTKWGNPFRITPECDRETAIARFRAWLLDPSRTEGPTIAEIQRDLRGRNLACWCRPDLPCHADILLEIANAPSADGR
jgi:Domain of unknown function (DUF4326)